MISTAEQIIEKYGLQKHIEGGWFVRTFESEFVSRFNFISNGTEDRFITTSIYYLLMPGEFSAFHKITQYETWHFYNGSPIRLYWFDTYSELQSVVLGCDVKGGELRQFTIPPNIYFAVEQVCSDSYSFMGCTVSPGFDYSDFYLAKQSELLQRYPSNSDIILKLTRQ